MYFLLDANLAPALTGGIRAAGHQCDHITHFLQANADDRAIATIANQIGACLISKDADFLQLKNSGTLVNALVWLRYGNMINRQTAARLLPALPEVVDAIRSGEGVVILW